MSTRRGKEAFTIAEVAVIICVILLVGFLLALRLVQRGHARPERIKCVNNLRNVGLAFRIYATDNNDLFPGSVLMSNAVELGAIQVTDIYSALSNEISTPKILRCPADANRKAAESFRSLSPANLSYFASLNASEEMPQTILAGDRKILVDGKLRAGVIAITTNAAVAWTKDIHVGNGNVTMVDGSVQQMSSARLRGAILDQELATNYLVFP